MTNDIHDINDSQSLQCGWGMLDSVYVICNLSCSAFFSRFIWNFQELCLYLHREMVKHLCRLEPSLYLLVRLKRFIEEYPLNMNINN